MSVLEFLDANIFTPVYNNDVPMISNEHIDAICEELRYAIINKETIFVYGDPDMDGFCSVMVWREVFSLLHAKPPVTYNYMSRSHNIDRSIIEQVKASDAKVVIICDTGSSVEDRIVLNMLQMEGYKTIVIDHHLYQGDYFTEADSRLTFNAYEEKASLGNCEVSGAFASLLVAKVLSEKYMHGALAFNAKCYALASMYSDVVDMSSPLARALYSSVALVKADGPLLFSGLNQWNYLIGRRLFSYIIVPKINGCFRSERFGLLNRILHENDRYRIKDVCNELLEVHDENRKLTLSFVPQFERKRIGDIVLCVHVTNDETRALHIRNYTGVVAAKIAEEEMTAVVVVVKDNHHYEGSYRDYYNRRLLDTFNLFCNVGGHPQAFGLSFNDLSDFERHLQFIGDKLTTTFEKPFITLNSSVIECSEDIDTLALYNEYMNVRPSVVLSHVCRGVKLVRQTTYNKYYTVGLPSEMQIMTTRFLSDGDTILLEPAICRGIELREKG